MAEYLRRSGQRQRPQRALLFRSSFRNTIYDVLKRRGWKETDSDLDWDLHWADREWVYEVFDSIHLDNWQRVNHFRNGRELCRKDLLIKNVKRQMKVLDKEGKYEESAKYHFCPTTYVLPGDYALFVEEFKKSHGAAWIMKPIGKAQGKGIFLFTKLSQISDWRTDYRWKPDNPTVESYVVQRYINNPYLIGGKKFDMRLYALVSSFSPLTVYVYRSGFARFSHTRYSNAAGDVSNQFVHLTNVAIQKTADNYDDVAGGKWSLRELKLHLICRVGIERTNRLFEEIQGIIVRSLLAVQKIMINDKHCFELYGYDVLFDDELRPWLLEVNASPSLSANTPADYDLKFKMLNDVLDVVDIEQRTTGREERIGGFDLVYSNGPVRPSSASYYTSHLGAHFDPRLNVFKPRAETRSESSGGGSSKRKDKDSKGRGGSTKSPASGRRPTPGRRGRPGSADRR